MFYKTIGEALCSCGHEVTYVSNFHNCFSGFSFCNEEHIIDINMKRGFSLSDYFLMPASIKRILIKNSFDFVCYSTPNASFYAAKALRNMKVPSVYYQFGLRFEGYNKYSIKRILAFLLEKRTCSWSTKICSLTQRNSKKNIFYRLVKNENKIGVVSSGGIPGVDDTVFYRLDDKIELRRNHGFNDDDFIISCMGRITADKGYDTIIAAFSNLPIKNKKLIIIGDFDGTDPVSKNTAKIIKNDGNIFVTSFVSQRQANEYLNMSDVFVHMSRREGFGQSVVEAMSSGLPVIVANVDGPAEVVDDEINGFVIGVDDCTSLIDKINFLYSNPQKVLEYGENGIKKVKQQFSRKRVVSEICSNLINMSTRK